MSAPSLPPSGHQYELVNGDQHAAIVEVGGGVRRYAVGDREVLESYPVDAMCDGAHGAPLIPWPNRLGDGRYSFDGQDFQVALNEPEQRNAIHGFLRWRNWQPLEQARDRIVMGTRLHPLTGYPFLLDVRVEYRLDDEGLVTRTSITNHGTTVCPVGSGQHPYLSPGRGLVDECELRLDASTRILTGDRQLPVGTEDVDGTEFDFRAGRRLGSQQIDFAFTDLTRDDDGRAWTRLTGQDGRTAQLWVDEAYPLVELYTGDTLAPERRRRGLGTEPMTCPPNAFASGKHLIRLEPGDTTHATWGVSLA